MSDPKDASPPSALKAWAGASNDGAFTARLRTLNPAMHEGSVQHPFPSIPKEAYREMLKGDKVTGRIDTAPVMKIPLNEIVGVQHSVNMERVMQHARDPRMVKPGQRASGAGHLIDMPVIVKTGGKYYCHDGHHRATVAKLRGDTEIQARVVDLDAER